MSTRTRFRTLHPGLLAGIFALFGLGACSDEQTPPLSPDDPARPSASSAAGEVSRAVISFGRSLPDAEVIQLLVQHDLQAVEVHMTAGGMFGSHERFSAADPRLVVETARRSSIGSTQKALSGSTIRFQRFREKHPRAAVLGSAKLEEQARSLVEVRASLEAVLHEARGNRPLIYAVEVSGSAAALDALATDRRVSHFAAVPSSDGKLAPPAPVWPAQVDIPRGITALRKQRAAQVYDHVEAYSGGDVGTMCIGCTPSEPEPELEPADTLVSPDDPAYYDGSSGPRPTYWPNEGDFWFNGASFTDSYFLWYRNGGWKSTTPGYEHNLNVESTFASGCTAWTNLPYRYNDCSTAGVVEPGTKVGLAFGSYYAKYIKNNRWYYGYWDLTGGEAVYHKYTEYTVTGQEVKKTFCWFNSPWCMNGVDSYFLVTGGWMVTNAAITEYRTWYKP